MTGAVTAPERAQMRRLRKAGVPERMIAAITGRALTTVQRHVGDLPSSAQGPRRALLDTACAALVREVASGRPAARIAWRYGVSKRTAQTIVAEARRAA